MTQIDSSPLQLESNFTNQPKIGNVPPPRQRPLVEGGSTMMEPLQMESEIARLAAWWR